MAAIVTLALLPVRFHPAGVIIDEGVGCLVQEGVGAVAQDVGSECGQILVTLGFQVAELMDHVGYQPTVALPVGMYTELQTRRSGTLVVVKKIGA